VDRGAEPRRRDQGTHGLVALDLDGTLIGPAGTEAEMPALTLQSLDRAAARGLCVTIITGRALPGLRQALGASGAALLEANPPVGVEYGTRIVKFDGSDQACHEPLPDRLVTRFITRLPLEAVDFVAYYPHDQAEQSVVWVPSRGNVSRIASGMTGAEVSSGSEKAILARLGMDRPSKIVVRLRPEAPHGTLGGTWRGGHNLNLLASRWTKGVALLRICHLLSARPAVSVAAGDHQADAAMLRLVPRGQRIVVGNNAGLDTLTGCLRIPAPAGLARAIDIAVGQALGSGQPNAKSRAGPVSGHAEPRAGRP
jgi:hydroxymethylpyrimidine pyrophosphatase-like HAD family hydrolase